MKSSLLFCLAFFGLLSPQVTHAVPGWTYLGAYNGHTYYRSNAAVAGTAIDATVTSFRTATALTAAQAYAVAMDNAGENAAVTTLRNNYNIAAYGSADASAYDDARNVWIGYTDRVTEGSFKWMNGQTTTYTNWLPGEPNDASGIEDYVQLIAFNSYSGKWNDMPGSTLLPVIVEVERPFALALTDPLTLQTQKVEGGLLLSLSDKAEVLVSRDGATYRSLGVHEGSFVDRRPAARNYYRLQSSGRSSTVYRADYPLTAYLVYNRLGQFVFRTKDVSAYENGGYVITAE